jgi:5-phospho-D-xylono-1,4-lactonase
MSFVRTILGDVAIDRLGCCGAHEHTIIDAPYIAEKHPDFLLDDIDAACTDLREFRDAGGGWVIDTMPTGAGRCTIKLATVSQQSAVHIVCPTGLHLPLYYPPDDPLLSMHREELVDVFVREIVDGVCDKAGQLPLPSRRLQSCWCPRAIYTTPARFRRQAGISVANNRSACTTKRTWGLR